MVNNRPFLFFGLEYCFYSSDIRGVQAAWSLAKDKPYSIKEAAAFFSRSREWVRQQIKEGTLTGFTLDSRGFSHVSGRDMNQFLKERSSAGE